MELMRTSARIISVDIIPCASHMLSRGRPYGHSAGIMSIDIIPYSISYCSVFWYYFICNNVLGLRYIFFIIRPKISTYFISITSNFRVFGSNTYSLSRKDPKYELFDNSPGSIILKISNLTQAFTTFVFLYNLYQFFSPITFIFSCNHSIFPATCVNSKDQKTDSLNRNTHFLVLFILFYYFFVIYPCAFKSSAQSNAPPAAPRTVLCDKPMNFQS